MSSPKVIAYHGRSLSGRSSTIQSLLRLGWFRLEGPERPESKLGSSARSYPGFFGEPGAGRGAAVTLLHLAGARFVPHGEEALCRARPVGFVVIADSQDVFLDDNGTVLAKLDAAAAATGLELDACRWSLQITKLDTPRSRPLSIVAEAMGWRGRGPVFGSVPVQDFGVVEPLAYALGLAGASIGSRSSSE